MKAARVDRYTQTGRGCRRHRKPHRPAFDSTFCAHRHPFSLWRRGKGWGAALSFIPMSEYALEGGASSAALRYIKEERRHIRPHVNDNFPSYSSCVDSVLLGPWYKVRQELYKKRKPVRLVDHNHWLWADDVCSPYGVDAWDNSCWSYVKRQSPARVRCRMRLIYALDSVRVTLIWWCFWLLLPPERRRKSISDVKDTYGGDSKPMTAPPPLPARRSVGRPEALIMRLNLQLFFDPYRKKQ